MNEPTVKTNLIKKAELARMLGVSSRTVDSWVARRIIPYLANSARLHLFDPVAVRSALAGKFGVNANCRAGTTI